jgi:hypothetical protein
MSDWSPISASHIVKNLSFQSKFLSDKLLSQKLGRHSASIFVSVPPPNIRKSIASFEASQISPICPHTSHRVEEDVQYSGRMIKKEKKTNTWRKTCPRITLPTTKLARIFLVSNPGLRQRTKNSL